MIMVIFYSVSVVVTILFSLGLVKLRRIKRLFRQSTFTSSVNTTADTPSVSVCIPARNESHAMVDCLDAVLASTYPKLEVIVLDDQSGDKTSALIKAYAHDGVRFVEGSHLQTSWLGKNHALNELLQEASGTYILFMDVDTRIAPDTIRQLAAYAQQQRAAMVSVLPRRDDGVRASIVFSPLRYLWTLLFHSSTSPAVASSAWLLHRQNLLDTHADLSDLKAATQPEAVLARRYAATDQYRFLIGSSLLGVSYEKKWRSQRDTSIRLLFPLLHMNAVRSVAAALGLVGLTLPIVFAIVCLLYGQSIQSFAGVGLYIFGAIVFTYYYAQVRRVGALLGGLLWPVLVLQEAILIIVSTVQYRRNHVQWKGRAVRLHWEDQS